MEQTNKQDYIDLRLVFKRLLENKKKFFITLPIVFVVACAYTLCIPRYYVSDTRLVPEIGGADMGGGLSGLAASFGIDLSNSQSTDAISPLLYPDLMDDNGFAYRISQIRVKSIPGADVEVDTTYYTYLKKYTKAPFWRNSIGFVKKLFKPKKKFTGGSGEYDPYFISEDDMNVYAKVRKNIRISVDKKTAVITISTTAQDPYIAKTMTDSIKNILQEHITEYRTNKARIDAEYYRQLKEDAKKSYEEIRQQFSDSYDANTDVMLKSVSSKIEDLENEMQLRYNAYSTMETQYQAALAKVQERTPAFTVLKGSSVPVKHEGPKRMITVLMLTFLAFVVLLLVSLKDDLLTQLKMK